MTSWSWGRVNASHCRITVAAEMSQKARSCFLIQLGGTPHKLHLPRSTRASLFVLWHLPPTVIASRMRSAVQQRRRLARICLDALDLQLQVPDLSTRLAELGRQARVLVLQRLVRILHAGRQYMREP